MYTSSRFGPLLQEETLPWTLAVHKNSQDPCELQASRSHTQCLEQITCDLLDNLNLNIKHCNNELASNVCKVRSFTLTTTADSTAISKSLGSCEAETSANHTARNTIPPHKPRDMHTCSLTLSMCNDYIAVRPAFQHVWADTKAITNAKRQQVQRWYAQQVPCMAMYGHVICTRMG